MTISKSRAVITTLDEWAERAGPKGRGRQWQPYRSAKEAARAWLGALPEMPPEIARLLENHPAFGAVTSWDAEPEAKLRFDRLGEPRNTDLLVRATDRFGTFWLAVECKADETFGESIASAARAAETRLKSNDASRGQERLRTLCTMYFGAALEEEPGLGRLRYQLLTATAGAIQTAHASGVQRVVLLIQEFTSSRTSAAKHASNGRALQAFVERFTRGAVTEIPSEQLVELVVPPEVVAHGKPPRFFVGKVTRPLPLGLE